MTNRDHALTCVMLAKIALKHAKNCREYGLRAKAIKHLAEAAHHRIWAIHYLNPSL